MVEGSRVRGRRVAAVAALCVLAAGVFGPTGQAGVESCTYDAGTKTMSATVADGSSATVVVSGGELWFGLVPAACNGATTTNTDSIAITGNAGTVETLTIDHRGGAFGPGATSEFNVPEIEMNVALGDTSDKVVLYGTEGDDYFSAGQLGLVFTTDGDVDAVFSPSIFLIEAHMLGGADHFNGRGEGGAGLHFLGDITLYGGPGDDPYLRGSDQQDLIYGGPGNDILRGEIGVDLLDGGEGNDSLAAGAGNDILIGGLGQDSFTGSSEDDVMYAEDDEADVSFAGGAGTDTLYYDEQVDPAPNSTEVLIGDGGPPPPPPGPCTYTAASKSVTATIPAGEQATLTVVAGAIHFGSTPTACGDATTTNTDSITINGSTGSSESLVLDLSGGAFAPGVASEGTGLQEIEVAVALGDATDGVVVYGSAADDTIRMGQNGLALNADTDADVTFAPLPAQIEIFGLGGVNTLTGTGGSGAGSTFTGKAILHAGDSGDLLSGGSGNDELYGGAGADTLEGNNGDDTLDGGAGNDNLKGGSGNDVMTGGAGADTFSASSGTDTMYANDDEADANINGGPDADTAYYDAGVDPTPVATETRIPA